MTTTMTMTSTTMSMITIIMTTMSMNIITIMMTITIIMTTTMMTTADAVTTMTIITIIMQMKSSQAGARKHLASIRRKKLRQSLRHLQQRTTNMASFFVQRVCCQALTVHGFISIWYLKSMKSVKDSRNTQAVSVSSVPRLMKQSLRNCLCCKN